MRQCSLMMCPLEDAPGRRSAAWKTCPLGRPRCLQLAASKTCWQAALLSTCHFKDLPTWQAALPTACHAEAWDSHVADNILRPWYTTTPWRRWTPFLVASVLLWRSRYLIVALKVRAEGTFTITFLKSSCILTFLAQLSLARDGFHGQHKSFGLGLRHDAGLRGSCCSLMTCPLMLLGALMTSWQIHLTLAPSWVSACSSSFASTPSVLPPKDGSI